MEKVDPKLAATENDSDDDCPASPRSQSRSSEASISRSASRSTWGAYIKKHTRLHDHSEIISPLLILGTMLVATCCGVAAFTLHLSVGIGGCLAGVNGCNAARGLHNTEAHPLLDYAKSIGVGPSLLFTVTCTLSGIVCSFILLAPCQGGVAKRCKGGGSVDTKVVIASGAKVNGWIVVLRILLATLYMGGGNPLGTEGPIIHMSSSLATWIVSKLGAKRRKFLSTFGVIGAAAGFSAGFNVLLTGFIYVIEELTRTLSRKLAIVLAFAAGVAVIG